MTAMDMYASGMSRRRYTKGDFYEEENKFYVNDIAFIFCRCFFRIRPEGSGGQSNTGDAKI